jgi:hypothetical protein
MMTILANLDGTPLNIILIVLLLVLAGAYWSRT